MPAFREAQGAAAPLLPAAAASRGPLSRPGGGVAPVPPAGPSARFAAFGRCSAVPASPAPL